MPPLPGEALDSWFDALSHRLHVPLSDLMPALGLPRRTRRRADHALDTPADWTILLRPAEIGAITAATGVPREVIEVMTLARYDQRAVVINRETAGSISAPCGAAAPAPGTARTA